jgi:hypothetical protein
MEQTMKTSEVLKTIADAGRASAWWITIIAIAVALMLMARACSETDKAKEELARERESRAIEIAGLTQLHDADKGALERELENAKAESASFEAELKRAQAELRARPIMVVRARTGPVPVDAPEASHPGHPDDATCLLRAGDQGEVIVNEAILESELGNRVLVGSADAFRVAPEPRVRLFGGEFRTDVTTAVSEPAPVRRESGWGVGLSGGVATTGPIGSVMLVTPGILDGALSADFIVTSGPGIFSAQAGALWRWEE